MSTPIALLTLLLDTLSTLDRLLVAYPPLRCRHLSASLTHFSQYFICTDADIATIKMAVSEHPDLHHSLVQCEQVWQHLIYMESNQFDILEHMLGPHVPELLYLMKTTLLLWKVRQAEGYFAPEQFHVKECYYYRLDTLSKALVVLETLHTQYEKVIAVHSMVLYKCHPLLVRWL